MLLLLALFSSAAWSQTQLRVKMFPGAQSLPVLAAVSEGFCNAVLEAQAMKLPVVCTDADGLPENVQDGTTGLVVTGFRVQFTDSAGITAPQITLPAPVPTTQIGSALANARGDMFFSLSTGVGCGLGHTGSIVWVIRVSPTAGTIVGRK